MQQGYLLRRLPTAMRDRTAKEILCTERFGNCRRLLTTYCAAA
jgi:hypothetical protein